MLVDLLETIWSNLRILVPMAGFVGLLLGLALFHRSTRAEGDPVARWRYRDLASDPALVPPRLEGRHSSDWPGSPQVDLPAARRMARAMLIAAIAMPAVVVILWFLQPGGFHGMIYEHPWYEIALPWVGVAGYLFGLSWMIRIYRADPEPDERTWRYRQ
ncbi:MAG TPA: hypothetical protein VFP66_06555 [Candidatus Limnocylindrales bacterium]|nr:hypothetical protein [Candidatus Limnocylindrales bacterium]